MPSIYWKRVSFIFDRFRGFWHEYKRSKRGLLGIIIIVAFGMVAIFAPWLTPYDPLDPSYPGFYPAQQPRLAEKLSLPIWYKTVLGDETLSENFFVVDDNEFSSNDIFNQQWGSQHTPPQYSVSVEYSGTEGSHNDDGCVQITYKRQETEDAPTDGEVS